MDSKYLQVTLLNIVVCIYLCLFNYSTCHSLNFQKFGFSEGLLNESIRAITQDTQGLMWVGTINGLYNFNGYSFNKIDFSSKGSDIEIKTLHSSNESLWVGTKKNGLFIYSENQWSKLNLKNSNNNKNILVYSIVEDKNGNFYIGTNIGLFVYSLSMKKFINNIPLVSKLEGEIVSSINFKDNLLVVATTGTLYLLNLNNSEVQIVQLRNPKHFIHDLYVDNRSQLWIGTNTALLKYDFNAQSFVNKTYTQKPTRILSIVENNGSIWVATIGNGILKINIQNDNIENKLQIKNLTNSDFERYITAMYFSSNNLLWVGTFDKGLNLLGLDTLKFGFEDFSDEDLKCISSRDINDFATEKNGTVWLANNEGLFKYNRKTKECKNIDFSSLKIDRLIVKSLNIQNNEIWLSTSKGFIILDKITEQVNIEKNSAAISPIYFSIHINNQIYLGSGKGLYKYDNTIKQYSKLNVPNRQTGRVHDYAISPDKRIYFVSSIGVLTLDSENLLSIHYESSETKTAFVDELNQLYISIGNNGLFKLGNNKQLIKQFSEKDNKLISTKILSIEEDNQNNLWMGSDSGLIKFNKESKKTHVFSSSDGTKNNFYVISSSHKGEDGALYFGGKNGMINFKPLKIKLSHQKMNIILTHLSLANKKVEPKILQESGFIINNPINQQKQIELNYKDIILSLEFAALDYADSYKNLYAYRLLGFKEQWIYTTAINRQATYTNLKPGSYTFQVKASNKDGIWSQNIKSIEIIKSPAPWFSLWAYISYIIIFISSILLYIQHKTSSSRKRAVELESIVLERTTEVKTQKKVVESLLEHKNEVFANISHEFKTPITLILGPIKQLLQEVELAKNVEKLSMVNRNANRLLVMVGHILKLSQSDNKQQIVREPQAINSILLMLFESFKPLADDKSIDLTYTKNTSDINIYASPESLEIIVSNLISNALKFTNQGGIVVVFTTVLNDEISISIKDNGSGIKEKDLDVIFNRFNRQNIHRNIQGTGLGLSVVKALVEGNKGKINVESIFNQGSTFTVTFPICQSIGETEISTQSIDNIVENTKIELLETKLPTSFSKLKNKVNILIIEDIIDMQIHINNILINEYNCSFADRGNKGIAIALKEIPDIIVCDIMMPEMDGYQVTNTLRAESKTSHIPIILLTALNTKESRIKGWRANIDMYMAKPFDGNELISRIENILSIRKILQQKTNTQIASNRTIESLGLSNQDIKFIEKLNKVIKDNFHNDFFLKPQFSSKMAYSESQLLRKVKALINKNPMDMLRDYRLEMAALKLKEGFQVGIVSDECGFNSISYFGRCFKNKYGVSPKKYQQLL